MKTDIKKLCGVEKKSEDGLVLNWTVFPEVLLDITDPLWVQELFVHVQGIAADKICSKLLSLLFVVQLHHYLSTFIETVFNS